MRHVLALAAVSLMFACSDDSSGPTPDTGGGQPDTMMADAGPGDMAQPDGMVSPDGAPADTMLFSDGAVPDAPPADSAVPDTMAADTMVADSAAADQGGTPPPSNTTVFFADDGKVLYWVDPTTLDVNKIGTYIWPTGTSTTKRTMTDLAVDASGNVYGVAWDVLYQVDASNATLTKVGDLTQKYNSLTFGDVGGSEVLLGLTKDGSQDTVLYKIDKGTATEVQIGALGTGLRSSGDLVYASTTGLLATLEPTPTGNDQLATVDTGTGAATIVGDCGVDDNWGVAFWKGKVYGFRDTGDIVEIDVSTGAATVKKTVSGVKWYSAGVSTSAPTS